MCEDEALKKRMQQGRGITDENWLKSSGDYNRYFMEHDSLGNERLTFNDIQRHHGPVLKIVDIAENYIKSNIHWRVEFTGALQRTEIPEIPVDAIREALLNSFCHKDYASGQSNEVAIYKDRVEIYNPGAFPEGYEPLDFIDKVEGPICRKPKIARILVLELLFTPQEELGYQKRILTTLTNSIRPWK